MIWFIRLILLAITGFASSKTFSQNIPLEKLLSFFNQNVSGTENFLQASGYEFRTRQSFPSGSEVEVYWIYDAKEKEHYVHFRVDTVRQIITSISYDFYAKEEYLELINLIPKLKFDDKKPLIYRVDGTDKEFTRIDANILLSTTKYDGDKFYYSLTICNCSFSH